MAAITSAGSGNWSNSGTWSGGVPANGDTVTIQAGHTVTFDVDQSAFAAGLAGLTINGTLEASTTTGSYYLKMAGNITASVAGGILRAGSSGTPYPSDCVFTIFMNGNYQINCHASNYLTLQLYCYDPPIKYAKLISATPKAITSITLGSTTTIGCTGHGYSVGNTVWLQDIGGTTELNDRFFEVATVPTADSFTIRWPDPDTAVDSTGYTAWTSGGIVCPQIAEASGQTQIEIDEDVSADVEWNRAGAIVNVDNVAQTRQGEAYTISGTTSTYLTLSSGLTNSKLSGSLAILATRNVRINSSATAINNGMIRYGSGHVLRCEIRPGSTSTDGVRYGSDHTVSGTVSGCSIAINGATNVTISACLSNIVTYGVFGLSGFTISGVLSNTNIALLGCADGTISGLISGSNYGLYSCNGLAMSGIIFGSTNAIAANSSGITISGTIKFCTTGINTNIGCVLTGDIIGCSTGVSSGAAHKIIGGKIIGCTTGVTLGAGYDFSGAIFLSCGTNINAADFYAVNSTISALSNYTSSARSIVSFAESINHDQAANAYRAWCRGGYIEDNTSTKYTGRSRSYEHICESANYYVFRNYTVTIPQGGGLVIECYVRKSALMSYLPRVWILTPDQEPFISGSPTQSATMTNSVDTWETLTLVYANSTGGDTTVTVRTVAKNASGSVFFDPIITVLAPATYDVYGTLLGYVDNLEERLTADRASKLDYLDATISSRLASAGYTAPLDAAGVRSAVGLASANLDTQIDGLPTAAEIVASLMAKIMSGSKTYEQAFLDLWAVIVGDSAADDGDEPTSITYDSPDGTVQRTHAITETTRTVS